MRMVSSADAREVEMVRQGVTTRRFDYIGSPGVIDAAPQAFLVDRTLKAKERQARAKSCSWSNSILTISKKLCINLTESVKISVDFLFKSEGNISRQTSYIHSVATSLLSNVTSLCLSIVRLSKLC